MLRALIWKPKLFLQDRNGLLESNSINVPLNFVNNCVCFDLNSCKGCQGALREMIKSNNISATFATTMPGIEGSTFARSSVKKFRFTSFACVKPTIEFLPTAGNQKREYQMILLSLDQWREGALSSPRGMLEIRERWANSNAYRPAQGRTVDRQLNNLN